MGLTKAEFKKALDLKFAPFEKAVQKTSGTTPAVVKKDQVFNIAKYITGHMTGRWENADFEKSQYFEVNKVMGSAVGTAGGFLVAPEYNAEVIELLRAKAIIRQMGPTVFQMNSDTLSFNRQTAATVAYWVEEGDEKTESDITLGQETLVLKEVAGITRVNNTLLFDSSPAVDTLIKSDLVKQLSLAIDLAFIQGTGGGQPLGIYNDPIVPTTTLGGGNGAAIGFDDLWDAMYAIEAANGTSNAWLIHPRTKNTLRKLKDGNGNYIYTTGDLNKGEHDNLLGLPVFKTTQIPITLTFGTGGANQSYMILGNWSEFVIGEKSGEGFMLDVSKERYFEFDQTAIRLVRRTDCLVRQPDEFYIIKGITV